MHHPWRAFLALTDWRLVWADLPNGFLGLTNFTTKTVTLTTGMTQAERRATIAHETQHIVRGPVAAGHADREELAVRRATARVMLPDIHLIGEALAWSEDLGEAADELWIDVATLRDRLRWLHPAERHYLRRRLAD